MNLKDIMTSVFMTLYKDKELTDLLEIPDLILEDGTYNIENIKKQIIEDRYPSDLVLDNLTRICVYEAPSTPTLNPNVEKGWLEIDIYVTKEKDRIDRRTLLIADRLIKLMDTVKRSKEGKSPVEAGVNLSYYNRLPNMATDNTDWKKFGLMFNYDYIRM